MTPYARDEPLIPIQEIPEPVVLRSIEYSKRSGMATEVLFVKRPAEYVRPVVPVDCVASVLPHRIRLATDGVMV
jgi:hypothetical protein